MKDHIECERRFLFPALPGELAGTPHRTIVVEQTYLSNCEELGPGPHRIRSWRDGVDTRYFHTRKSPPNADGGRREVEREITKDEFEKMLRFCDPGRRIVQKRRHVFVHAGLEFELDEFTGELAGLVILEVELERMDAPLELPDWMAGVVEITGDSRFGNFTLAGTEPERVRHLVKQVLRG